MGTAPEFDAATLSAALKALSHPVRLDILRALRVPKRIGDLRLASGTTWAGLQPQRSLSRPAIFHHVEQLEEMGFVERVDEEGRYVVNQQRMFAFLGDLGALARIRPVVDLDVPETLAADAAEAVALPPPPRLLVVAGPKEGHAIALAGEGPWRVGRGADVELRLEYDPHVSREHILVRRSADGRYAAEPNPSSKNPAWLNYRPVPAGGMDLAPGDILSVGSSRIAYQAR